MYESQTRVIETRPATDKGWGAEHGEVRFPGGRRWLPDNENSLGR